MVEKSPKLKPCGPDKYRSKRTNRCRKYKSKTLKPCKSYQYRSTETKRCRNKGSKKILKPCKSHQYRSEVKPRRCLNKSRKPRTIKKLTTTGPRELSKYLTTTGPRELTNHLTTTGHRELSKYLTTTGPIKSVGPEDIYVSPKIIYDIKNISLETELSVLEILNKLQNYERYKLKHSKHVYLTEWKFATSYPNLTFADIAKKSGQIIDTLGKIDTYYVYVVVNKIMYTMKIINDISLYAHELNFLEILEDTGIVPKIYSTWIYEDSGFIIFEDITKCNMGVSEFSNQMSNALSILYRKNILYVDIYEKSYMCKKSNGKLVLVDFEWAVTGKNGKLYPEHPLSDFFGFDVSWEILMEVQDFNFELYVEKMRTLPMIISPKIRTSSKPVELEQTSSVHLLKLISQKLTSSPEIIGIPTNSKVSSRRLASLEIIGIPTNSKVSSRRLASPEIIGIPTNSKVSSRRLTTSPRINTAPISLILSNTQAPPVVSNLDRPYLDVNNLTSIGKSGKLLDVTPVAPFSSLSGFENIIENCDQKQWTQESYISKGKYGQVYVACDTLGSCDYVLKIQNQTNDFHTEVIAMHELQKTGVVPKIYAAWTCKGKGYIIMEKLAICKMTSSEKYKQIKKNLEKIYNAGWLFIDIHPGNFLCRNNGKDLVLIDFGWAVKKGPLGDKQTYPYHPVSEDFGLVADWHFLKTLQNYNLETFFNPNTTPEEFNAMQEAKKAYGKLHKYLENAK